MADVAVLLSGGLDSAVLVAHAARTSAVQPIYVSAGLAWEREERALVERLLQSPPYASGVLPLAALAADVTDIYPAAHWARRGAPPAYDTPDEDVYLPGRNVLLLSKAGVLCALRGIPRIAIGPLAGNPFPDATPEFLASMAQALSIGLAHPVAIDAPFSAMHKEDVIALGRVAGRAVRADDVVHEAGGREALRAVQQVPRAPRRVRAAGVRDPTEYLAAAPR